MRRLTFWIGLAVSAVALWLAFREVDWDSLGQALRNANYLWLIPSALALLAAMAARAERWRWLLGGRERVSFGQAFRALSIGYLVTNVFPFRLGEVVRPVVVSRGGKVPAMQAFSTIALEHVLDVLVVLAILALVLPGLPLPEGAALGAQRGGLIFGGLAVVMLIVVWQRARAERLASWGLQRIPRLHPDPWLRRFNSVMDGLSVLRSPRLFTASIVWSLGAWVLSAISFHLALIGFAPDAPFTASLFVTATTTLVLLAPSSPGYIGVIELAIQQSLVVFGISDSIGLAYAIAFHAMEFIVMNVAGIVGLMQEGMSWSAMVSTVHQAEVTHEAPAVTE
ncbi:MAG TPA: lysylphosphatidylglycerol synthase transmembrane domain-containing protein [Anaerolineae bacterium]|nr:lysylphosphatidylglycerol synthase transmembrane domain-containing protein [Anaerolineae bacterium]